MEILESASFDAKFYEKFITREIFKDISSPFYTLHENVFKRVEVADYIKKYHIFNFSKLYHGKKDCESVRDLDFRLKSMFSYRIYGNTLMLNEIVALDDCLLVRFSIVEKSDDGTWRVNENGKNPAVLLNGSISFHKPYRNKEEAIEKGVKMFERFYNLERKSYEKAINSISKRIDDMLNECGETVSYGIKSKIAKCIKERVERRMHERLANNPFYKKKDDLSKLEWLKA
jgi:hypothetical protein